MNASLSHRQLNNIAVLPTILSLETSLLWLRLSEVIYKKTRELFLVENIPHRGSRCTKFDCRLQKGAKRKYITTPFHALGCKSEEMQNTRSSLTEVTACNSCAQINPGIAIFHSFEKTNDEWGKKKQTTWLQLPHCDYFKVEPSLFNPFMDIFHINYQKFIFTSVIISLYSLSSVAY